MSNTVRTDEIDEVLSSVRRLVTKTDKETQIGTASNAEAQTEKFVLTQALRVYKSKLVEHGPNHPDTVKAVADKMTEALKQSEDRAGLEATIAELEAAVRAPSNEWDEVDPEDPEDFDGAAWAASAFELRDLSPELEAFFAAAAEEELKAELAAHESARLAEDAEQEDFDDEAPETQVQDDVPALAQADGDTSASEPVEEALANDAAPQEPADEREPDSDDDVPDSDSAEPEGNILGEPGPSDKDMLRELVAQIVREELSGELGERITRNVRKLVRREINRVLISRDLD